MIKNEGFESLVNLEGCKTNESYESYVTGFESLVNLEGCKTIDMKLTKKERFESLVNLEGCKTARRRHCYNHGLRVLLI